MRPWSPVTALRHLADVLTANRADGRILEWDAAQSAHVYVDHPSQADFDDHSARHEDGGADEITVAGLSGELADPQTPKSHGHPEIEGTVYREVALHDFGSGLEPVEDPDNSDWLYGIYDGSA